ncbi:MAG: PQQ-binding-like beta-propeller repeat protein [Gammaproteobacteria bacterium]
MTVLSVIRALATAAALLACGAACGEDWASYNRTPQGQRFVEHTQIDAGNLARLRVVCEARMGIPGTFHAGPVLIGATLYVTTGLATVALDPTDCSVRWKHLHETEGRTVGSVNRGIAHLDGRVFRGTLDGFVLAIDAGSGKELWRRKMADPMVGERFVAAPTAWDGKVFMGTSGGDFGIKSRIFALDARTGEQVWSFNAIPAEGEFGYDTWRQPRPADFGGAGFWSAFALDPLAGELFVPLGNPAPMFSPDARPGDNLFTNSLVVLDARTGRRRWHYQFTPNDGHDYDAGTPPVLHRDPQGRDLVIVGSKDGHVYAIDRTTHALAWRTPVTTIENADAPPTPEGVRACPGYVGGMQWNSPAVDARRNLVFASAVDWCGIFQRGEPKYLRGMVYTAGKVRPAVPSDQARGWIHALDASSGAVRWRWQAPAPMIAAVTATASGLVMTGDLDGRFHVFDAHTGRQLYSRDTGGSMTGGVISYLRGGRQYIAHTSGSTAPRGFTFDTMGRPSLVILALGSGRGDDPQPRVVQVDAEPAPAVAAGDVDPRLARARTMYGYTCSTCHGEEGGGGSGPALKAIADRLDAAAIVEILKNPRDPMPRLHPDPLDDADVAAMAEFVRTLR